jgi:hypothetical protein
MPIDIEYIRSVSAADTGITSKLPLQFPSDEGPLRVGC